MRAGSIRRLAATLSISESQLRNRLSDLLVFYEEYLAFSRIRNNPRLRAALAVEQAMETNHVNYLERSLPRTDRLLTEWKYTSTYSHYEFLRFKRVNFEYRTDLSNKISQEDLLAMYEAFEEFTLIEKSKLYLDSIGEKNVLPELKASLDSEIHALSAKLGVAKEEDGLSPRNIYYHLLRIVQNEDHKSYEYLFINIRQVLATVSVRDGKRVVVALFNTLSRKINLGRVGGKAQYLELITIMLEFPKIKISEWLLKNFVTLLCRVNDWALAQRVLAVYLPGLPADRREQAEKYNEAVIMMAQQQYGEAIDLFNQMSLADNTYYMGARYHLFRALYELNDYVGLLALLKSFRSYLNTLKHLPKDLLAANINFIKYFTKLIKLKMESPYVQPSKHNTLLEKLAERLMETKEVINREWLLEKITTDHQLVQKKA